MPLSQKRSGNRRLHLMPGMKRIPISWKIHAIMTRKRILIRRNCNERSKMLFYLSNKRYRQVLFGTYLAGMDERELATLLGVQVQEVYLWRHRALKALRSNRKVAEALRLWLR